MTHDAPAKTIPENEVKQRLRVARIPTTVQHLCQTVDDVDRLVASARAEQRWVVKVSVDGLTHKSAVGGVHVDVPSTDLRQSFTELDELGQGLSAPGGGYHGVLVEEYAGTGVEVAIGFHRDPQLGPVVMVGDGGTEIEGNRNVRFAAAPLTVQGAATLVDQWVEVSRPGQTLTGSQLQQVADMLVGVAGPSGLTADGDVASLDINPILVTEDGVVAVDGVLVPQVDGAEASRPGARRTTPGDLTAFLDPESLAVIGASNDPSKPGHALLKNLVDFGYRGRLHAVHPTAAEVCGVPVVPTVADIEAPVDKAIVLVSNDRVPDVVAQCAKLDIPAVHIYTAGFAEQYAGTDAAGPAAASEAAILGAIAGTRTRVMGPNCWGAYSPRARITSTAARFASSTTGRVGFLSQSGTHYLDVVRRSNARHLPLYGALSVGNCLDVSVAETASYLLAQPDVDVLGAYVEGTDGTRDLVDLIDTTDKPVIVLRGGRTVAGGRAAASHTAALAADDTAWFDLVTGAGGIVVDTIEEMLDTLTAVAAFGRIRGPRLTMYGPGGGVGVTGADIAGRSGLVLPVFDTQLSEKLTGRFASPGTSMANPVDVTVWDVFPDDTCVLSEVASLIGDPAVTDSTIMHLELGSILDTNPRSRVEELIELLIDDLTSTPLPVPTSLVARTGGIDECSPLLHRIRERLHPVGVPVFETIQDAVTTHARIAATHTTRA